MYSLTTALCPLPSRYRLLCLYSAPQGTAQSQPPGPALRPPSTSPPATTPSSTTATSTPAGPANWISTATNTTPQSRSTTSAVLPPVPGPPPADAKHLRPQPAANLVEQIRQRPIPRPLPRRPTRNPNPPQVPQVVLNHPRQRPHPTPFSPPHPHPAPPSRRPRPGPSTMVIPSPPKPPLGTNPDRNLPTSDSASHLSLLPYSHPLLRSHLTSHCSQLTPSPSSFLTHGPCYR